MEPLDLYISTSRSAAINLAFEEVLLGRGKSILLLYRNSDAVILGKHQNVWKEVHVSFCRANGIGIHRRLSGGGCVFHDEGNLNFSFIRKQPSDIINFREHILPVQQSLLDMGYEVEINQRNDLFSHGKKISGNAEHVFRKSKMILHHGTLLFDSKLDKLSEALKPELDHLETHAVNSVRSPVRNLSEQSLHPGITAFERSLIQALGDQLPIRQKVEVTPQSDPEVMELAKSKYLDWEWNFAKSPQFSWKSQNTELKVRQARVISIEGEDLTSAQKAALIGTPLRNNSLRELGSWAEQFTLPE